MTITTEPPKPTLTSTADYAKLELAVPASAVDPRTKKINSEELLRQIALALDHEDGTPAEVVATIVAWSDHLRQLEEADRWQAFLEWEAYVIAEGGPFIEEEMAEAERALTIQVDDEGRTCADERASDVASGGGRAGDRERTEVV